MTTPKECMICYRDEAEWNGSARTKCGHEMCMDCFLCVVGKGGNCPMCRGGLPSIQVEAPAPAPAPVIVQRIEQSRWERGQQLKRESKMRRSGYLNARKEEWTRHCTSCSDASCIATHERKTKWLNRGKLCAVPPALRTEGRMMIGYILGLKRMGKEKSRRLAFLIPDYKEHQRRSFGLWRKIEIQQEEAQRRKMVRTETAGNNTERLATGVGVKVFTGFTLPKRGARTGDRYEKDGRAAQCVGFHLWQWVDGTKSRLDGKHWVIC